MHTIPIHLQDPDDATRALTPLPVADGEAALFAHAFTHPVELASTSIRVISLMICPRVYSTSVYRVIVPPRDA